mgnify:CR=1 FL=1
MSQGPLFLSCEALLPIVHLACSWKWLTSPLLRIPSTPLFFGPSLRPHISFNQLVIPEYSSKHKMKEQLDIAIEFGAAGFGQA